MSVFEGFTGQKKRSADSRFQRTTLRAAAEPGRSPYDLYRHSRSGAGDRPIPDQKDRGSPRTSQVMTPSRVGDSESNFAVEQTAERHALAAAGHPGRQSPLASAPKQTG
jgi:hypothetical protein